MLILSALVIICVALCSYKAGQRLERKIEPRIEPMTKGELITNATLRARRAERETNRG